jgi:ATP-dependent RNA helicase DHX8/PRP22
VKIVANPDGSMQRAAVEQGTLAKERRELKTAQANSLIDAIPKDLSRPWEDPLPDAGERHFAQELRSVNLAAGTGETEWQAKQQKNKALSYGVISEKSIKQQRESLPIYKLKSELMKAINDHNLLVVSCGAAVSTVYLRFCAAAAVLPDHAHLPSPPPFSLS